MVSSAGVLSTTGIWSSGAGRVVMPSSSASAQVGHMVSAMIVASAPASRRLRIFFFNIGIPPWSACMLIERDCKCISGNRLPCGEKTPFRPLALRDRLSPMVPLSVQLAPQRAAQIMCLWVCDNLRMQCSFNLQIKYPLYSAHSSARG